jgi:hypothetical protein
MAKPMTKQQRAALRAAYRTYLLQWGKPKSPFWNQYNLFYDFNYWDRYWVKKVRKSLTKRGVHLST